MFMSISDNMRLSSERKKTLRNMVITENSPGTIIHDFNVLLTMLKADALPLTKSHQLSMRVLSEINAQLAHPIQLGLKRPQQKSYPHIHGLYLLVRASGLTYVGGTEKKQLLMMDEEAYQSWKSLNLTEQYGSLLETWFLRGNPEIIRERTRAMTLIPDTFYAATSFYDRIPADGQPIAGDKDAEERLKWTPGWYNLGLLELFGLIKIQHGSSEPGKGWRIEYIYRTPEGDAVLAMLFSRLFHDFAKIFQLEEKGEISFGVFQPIFRFHFREWKNSLTAPEWVFREGTYIFKVSLGTVWCRIAINTKQDLDSLSSIILDAVDFDDDHLYQFLYQNRYGFNQPINHPFMDDGPYTSDVRVGDVPLRVGQTMIYVFDFGDWWAFDVTLEQIKPDEGNKGPRILETHGKPPEQYRSWE
jgi:hypothetical protein